MIPLETRVVPVEGRRDLDRFLQLPHEVYRRDPRWVPPLLLERRLFFNRVKNPYFRTADVRLWMALRGGAVVGTLAAHVDRGFQDLWKEPTAFFGFFEVQPDEAAARLLFDEAFRWAKSTGAAKILGPMSFNTNHECGMLVEGFETPPMILMTHNPPYYPRLLEEMGFRKAKDLLAYELQAGPVPEGLESFADAFAAQSGLALRPVRMKDFDAEVARMRSVYNRAWSKNWGFVPLSEEEFRFMAQGMKIVVDPDFALFVEREGRPVAFALVLPDFNVVLKAMGGRLLPFGWLKGLLAKRRIRALRVFALGVVPEEQAAGIGALLYRRIWKQALAKGYTWAEMSWILEDNVRMNKAIQRMGGKVYKRYRVYERDL